MPTREPLPKFHFPPSNVRRPPPPRRPGKEELNTELEPFKFLHPPVQQIISGKTIESLPDELLFEVLARIPPGRQQEIYEARLVCRKLYHIIHTRNFMSAYLHHSTYGLLLKSKIWESLLILPQRGRGGGVEITQLKYKRRGAVVSSCNGLWLENSLDCKDLYVTNPTTGKIVLLPPFVCQVFEAQYAMAYVPASMEYKVVIFYPPDKTPRAVCHILTAGVDKTWRDVDLGLVSKEASMAFYNIPLVTDGFIHWNHPCTHHLLTLNVETETITETPSPPPTPGSLRYIYLSTRKYLSLLLPYGRKCSWEVWEMSRPETGEWRKKADFCLEVPNERFNLLGLVPKEFLLPVGWVKGAQCPLARLQLRP
ncbi:Unknown protein [Striga hermonthica]|uniref:F-box domain-containing protein n=1 Tax=Striga hermonthica TaxID=68872 RepID=A0A9N7RGQ3_STRHE|nr:Unknown protein [Striga hermonthica]